jgi:cytochrome c-type biogenesis protein CcmH
MVARYGDFVLYRPPVKGLTLMLWGGPAFLLLLGLIALFTYLRKRNQVVAEQRPLSEEENRRLSAMLADQADEAQKNNK